MTTLIARPPSEGEPTSPLPATAPPTTVLPPSTPPTQAASWLRRLTAHFWSRSGYLLGTLPTVVIAYSIGVSLFFFSLATAIVYIGVLSGALTLLLVHYVASFYKIWLSKCGYQFKAEPAQDGTVQDGRNGQKAASRWLRRILGIYAKPQRWRELAFLFVNFFLTVVTWTITVVWWALSLSGLTYWFWSRFLPVRGPIMVGEHCTTLFQDNGDIYSTTCHTDSLSLSAALHLPAPFSSIPDAVLLAVAGLILLLLLIPLTQGLAWLHGALARGLLNPTQAELRRAELAARVQQVETSRTAATEAQTDDLRQIEQDLHDGPQQGLVRLGMDLARARRRLAAGDVAGTDDLLGQARQQVDDILAQIRQISRRTAPPILAEQGLPAALESLAATCPLPTIVDAPTGASQADSQQRLALDRLSPAAQTALYFSVGEALSNAAKYSGASRVVIRLRVLDAGSSLTGPATSTGPVVTSSSAVAGDPATAGSVLCEIEDNGHGGAQILPGHGLAGLCDRLAGVDGNFSIYSSPSGGSLIQVSLPLPAENHR